ncbi:asparagine synthase [Medicago truncatula]|uniref:Asparagine synthase n=1 Tax=Medicago truncatula TaxID=3880 RepID=A0A072UY80_MEDTR|nr:asparagine synthase [Medicago truncatula]
MCGIALTVSGIRINISSLPFDSTSLNRQSENLLISLDDLKEALRRRGPDSLGVKKVTLQHNEKQISSFIEHDETLLCSANEDSNGELHFIGATLQLRGTVPLVQPLVDASRNILVYNGEIFGGLQLASDCNDAEFLMQTLGNCCSCGSCLTGNCVKCGKGSITDVLSTIKGPWAIIYWQDSSRTLWFGRDAFGRRSLLVHWPTEDDSTFLLSSVSPVAPDQQATENEAHNGIENRSYWEELPCGVYSMHVDASNSNGFLVGEVQIHEYTNSTLKELIKWERISVVPSSENLQTFCPKFSRGQQDVHSASLETVPCEAGSTQNSIPMRAHMLLNVLKESVIRRTSLYTIYQAVISGIKQEKFVPVAILFSGGLDSMILAALLDQCLDPTYEIDLLTVSFDGELAPDRKSAKTGLKELKRVAPSRRWRLVEIDADLSDLVSETSHVMSLINPANTYMDLNIGIALWLASCGDGWVSADDNDDTHARIKYKSNARILLVGSGADEQCAGYGRHRTSFRRGSWLGLDEEMKLDMQRIWKRNLGRDDRCIADNGKEISILG